MLDTLLATKLKKALLSILFATPKRSFTVDELRVLSRGPLRATSESLRDLARADVVEIVTKKSRRYYRINSYFPLFAELRDLVITGKSKFGDQVAKKLRAVPNLRLIVLSGIFAFQPHLAVDILLVGNDVNRTKLSKALSEVETLVGQEVNYTLFDLEEFDYRRYMSDRFIRDILDNPHIIVFSTIRK